jgi:hypothetical protein
MAKRNTSGYSHVDKVPVPIHATEPPEREFIRTLLEQQTDDEEIMAEFADRLLAGETDAPPDAESRTDGTVRGVGHEGATEAPDDGHPAIVLVPSLRDLVAVTGLNSAELSVAFEADGQGHIRVMDRHFITVSDGERLTPWSVASLRELFRGNRQPPPGIDHYPEEYCGHFFFIEKHLLTACSALGDRTDQEMEELYSTLRRRPDGRSLGQLHDFLWQVCALLLGKHELSSAEFEAITGQLERSVRKWALRPVSRNYVDFLRSSLP